MDEWSKAIWIFVELMISSLILISMVVLARMSGDVGRIQQSEIDAVESTKEFRTYFKYEDNEEMYSQDIISLIFETRGYPEVWVEKEKGASDDFTFKWNPSIPTNDKRWDLTHISEKMLEYDNKYKSSIVKNANGEISRIEFRRIE
ncbi:hypothetical protein SH1V18_11150 [Vallitalea longa]|uniref:Uncharacterized protein n=1 Tax=Vallitalea longa TaxID=2936439 RepID=A0A9W6DDR6_9FIRM|nr:hypothetical protein [Vallitalea longa]GKX28635.1 hypothetical protein SH1V18_11150 [Vallitalea longa]